MFFHYRCVTQELGGGAATLIATIVCPFGPVVMVSCDATPGELARHTPSGRDRVRLTRRERRAFTGLVRRFGIQHVA